MHNVGGSTYIHNITHDRAKASGALYVCTWRFMICIDNVCGNILLKQTTYIYVTTFETHAHYKPKSALCHEGSNVCVREREREEAA